MEGRGKVFGRTFHFDLTPLLLYLADRHNAFFLEIEVAQCLLSNPQGVAICS
jgi:hypothetical protein